MTCHVRSVVGEEVRPGGTGGGVEWVNCPARSPGRTCRRRRLACEGGTPMGKEEETEKVDRDLGGEGASKCCERLDQRGWLDGSVIRERFF
jgi:hypothetical protein